ncbi:alpha/beta fold hydrolase [Wenxinia saemankumensis]|uniref:Pimeloyl-ACP methyl ester carboxylesterase n=1 Tax=Wenxinia saemankumensis TaxID=1447782 RepID=A0A1M6CFU2_9RHOB|nr:alpha/beta hydrolase [Wenxinia saemankumensis]SHI59614.1 Pimeloyl-ACP methyl ester carboxylesterase [Wenxinia saemankumensis]
MSAPFNEPLVLLPGLLTDARLFRPQIDALSTRGTIAVAGYGLGERVEEIASSLLSMIPARTALVGAGFGGAVALELIRRAPERVTRIALISTHPLAPTPAEAAEAETRIVAAKAGRFEDVIAKELPEGALGEGPNSDEARAAYLEMARAVGPAGYLRRTRAAMRRKDQQATIRRIHQRALVICGEADPLTPVKRHSFMAEMIPTGTLRVIEGAGHLPSLEAPEAVTEALAEWMGQPLVLR